MTAKIIRSNRKINELCATCLIMLFVSSMILAFAPFSSAQVGITQPRKTAGYISIAPTLIGIGQTLTVNLWVLPVPQDYATHAYYQGYTGIEVTFIKPDGTKDKFTPVDGTATYAAGQTEALGTMYFSYTPKETGNWSVQFTMPAQNFTDRTGTVQWTACTSNSANFTVQTEPVNTGLTNGYPYSPLPNEYWSYPINSNNREWYQISGDWLTASLGGPFIANMGGYWQQYGSAPNTAHILWDIPYSAGGLVGGNLGSISYSPYMAGIMSGSIVIDGKLFLNVPTAASSTINGNTFECIDLTTGKILYTASGTITSGIHLPGNTYIQSLAAGGQTTGVTLASSIGATPTPYLFQNLGTTWNYYDPSTGALVRSITNVTASMCEFIDDSPLAFGVTTLSYNLNTDMYAVNYVWEWNITKVVNNNWQTGLVWTTNANSPGHPGPGDGSTRYGLTMTSDFSTIVYGGALGDNLVSGFDAQTGKSKWNITLPYSSDMGLIQLYNTTKFVTYDPTFSTFYCYSGITGELLWSTPNVGNYPWSTKYSGDTVANDNSNIYIGDPDGSIIALSLDTGKVVWQSTVIPSGEYNTNEIPYWFGLITAGGNVYAYAGYSATYQINPIPRSAMLVCVNATTGQTTWTLNGGVYPVAAANGYITGYGQYDGNYYCIGKGKTSTTVSLKNDIITQGATVLIQGNVLDQSPAQPGTPAVSDASMSEWMDYLHMQNATLLNTQPSPTGVQVTLTALDPNGNTENIGTATTDAAGQYAISWSPPVPGLYTITAAFSGTNAYWRSSAESKIDVLTATTTATPTVLPISTTDTYFIPAIAGLFVLAVAVLILLVALILRKRP